MNKVRRMARRLEARYRLWRDTGDELRRRVQVENYLWGVAAGNKPPPDAAKCRELAIKLGVPSRYKEDV